jgi:hypothetical protein
MQYLLKESKDIGKMGLAGIEWPPSASADPIHDALPTLKIDENSSLSS